MHPVLIKGDRCSVRICDAFDTGDLVENIYRSVYTYNALNQLILENDTVYTYDNNGALIAVSGPDRSAAYTYNDLGRMSTATVTAGTTTVTESYLYDWDGTRTAKITDAVLTYYLVDTGGVLSQVLAELDHTGALITHYTRGAEIISLSRPGEKHYYLNDGHGTVRALSDADGQVTDTYLYDAFGNLLSKTGTTANDFLYTGEQYDANTGFYYLRARYMNPSTGTFTSPDAYAGTIFDPVSLHKYLYANANPVMNRDPSGYYTLTEMESAMAIQAIIGGAMNGTTKAVLGAIGYFREGGRFNMDFVGTFMSDFIWGAIDGAIIGGLFGAFGYLATQSLLASFLLRSFFGTMGVKSAWDFIQDLRRGDYGRAILDGLSAVLFFWGASQNYYRGGGLGNHGGNQGKNNPADDVADDAANLGDDAANTSQNLYDGARMSTDDALTAAEDFLGTGYSEIAPGVFRSSDGLRQVRMTVSDLAGHGIDPHMNFEVGISTTNPGGRVTFIAKENMHIFIEG